MLAWPVANSLECQLVVRIGLDNRSHGREEAGISDFAHVFAILGDGGYESKIITLIIFSFSSPSAHLCSYPRKLGNPEAPARDFKMMTRYPVLRLQLVVNWFEELQRRAPAK
jgi:hypothetical protein